MQNFELVSFQFEFQVSEFQVSEFSKEDEDDKSVFHSLCDIFM